MYERARRAQGRGRLIVMALGLAVAAPAGAVCPADINNSGVVDVDDLLAVVSAWGGCSAPCPPYCPADIDDNCTVNVEDLLAVIGAWGPCPCPDVFEPNDNCGAVRTLATVGSDQTVTYASSMNLSSAGDVDYFLFPCHETDSSCYCGLPFVDEDYIIKVTLTVPASASAAYEFCLNVNSCNFPSGYCFTVQPGQSLMLSINADGDCSGVADHYPTYVRIAHIGGAGAADCAAYTLSCFFDAGYCF